jgi:hypothetical protein
VQRQISKKTPDTLDGLVHGRGKALAESAGEKTGKFVLGGGAQQIDIGDQHLLCA